MGTSRKSKNEPIKNKSYVIYTLAAEWKNVIRNLYNLRLET